MPCTLPEDEIEYNYLPRKWSYRKDILTPDEILQDYLTQADKYSQKAREVLDAELGISYGDLPRHKFDMYHKKGAPTKGAPIFVFLHGGYWWIKELGRENSAFGAVPLCDAGATVVSMGYELCPERPVAKQIEDIKDAVRVIIKLAKERESSGIWLCGHSAGAQLSAWALGEAFGGEEDRALIKGAIFCGGVFDLKPLTKIYTKDKLRMTEEEAEKVSPTYYPDEVAKFSAKRHLVFALSVTDPPEYKRQSQEFYDLLNERQMNTSWIDIPDTDHYNLVTNLGQPDYKLTKEIIKIIGL